MEKKRQDSFFEDKYVFAAVRVAAFLALVLWVIFSPEHNIESLLLPVILFFVIYSVIAYFLFAKKIVEKSILHIGTMLFDLVMVTWLIHLTGGLDSSFFLAYFLLSAVHSLYGGLKVGLSVATMSLTLYFLTNMPIPMAIYGGDLMLRGGILFTMVSTIGYLSDRLRFTQDELEKKVHRFSTLTEVARTVSSSLELRQVLKSVVQLSVVNMKVKGCTVHILDEEKGVLRPMANLGIPSLEEKLLPIEGCFGEVIKTGVPFVCSQHNKQNYLVDQELLQEYRQLLAVPLRSRNKILGVLTVFSDEEVGFSREDQELIELLSVQMGHAIENASAYQKQRNLYHSVVQAFIMAIDAKDSYTRSHSEYVHRYSKLIAERMGLSEEAVDRVAMAATLHDIGKIGINSSILRKPGALTDAEYAEIKMHVIIGEQIISQVPEFRDLASTLAAHHEWYNGKGYPEGLAGDNIPLGARIIAVADAYEAMTANRVYRKALAREKAIGELIRGKGTQFDPIVVDVFLELHDEGIIDDVSDQSLHLKGSVSS
ncbi:HD domain-containing protein [Heliorestis acidaminivorans]|uniref:HD domain-containing protein n=1 Tax=Heliorestis acidaminivorans TaxID=553427 RepID=A0A6I0EYM2_9FIRM|nr:HD domain-containing phosphohydrolase [Heliorestis acidaminivorans]KAB2951695.1 HD domain-containing protein [Heliorestis acidaminivorans]